MRILTQLSLVFLLLFSGLAASSQQLRLGKNSSNLQKSAILELESDNQGMLLSRITDTSLVNSLNPPDGMIIYFVPAKSLLIRTSSHWEPLATAPGLSNYWSINGNSNGSVKKIGTNDNRDFPFVTNNLERARILANGNVGINTTTAAEKLDVNGNMVLRNAFMPGNLAGTAGQVLRSNGANVAPSWMNAVLANLGDVSITNPVNGQLLLYNGTSWTNSTPSYLTSIDTGNISSFHTKVKSLFSAAAPITYNAGVIGITQATTSTNGFLSSADWNTFNNKLNVIDTGNIANFHLKVKRQLSAGTGISYSNTTGVIGNTGVLSLNGNTGALTMDTGYISNFHLKSKSLLSAGPGITYNATTGVIGSNFTAGNFWSTTGNTGMDNNNNFIGNIDDRIFRMKANNTTMVEMGRRVTLGLTQNYTDYMDDNEPVLHMKSAVQFFAPMAQFYKPKIFVDAYGNFRTKGSAAMTDYFEFGATGTNNDGGFEFIIGDDGDEPIVFKSFNYATNTTSEIMRLQNGRMAVGSNTFNSGNPEKLLVDAGATTSYNLMTGKGSINNYLQINVQNQSGDILASSDLVATSNNGDESNNFIDMGINGGGFTNTTYPMISGANTAYLYSTGNDFVIGNATANKNLRLFTGGYAAANERLRIDGTGNVGIATTTPTAKLDAAGTFKMGAKGTVEKNLMSFEVSVASNTSVPGGNVGALACCYTPGTLEYTIAIPAAAQPTSTRGTVSISTDNDLAANLSIASARILSTTQVKVRILNTGTANQSLPAGLKFYVTITEF